MSPIFEEIKIWRHEGQKKRKREQGAHELGEEDWQLGTTSPHPNEPWK